MSLDTIAIIANIIASIAVVITLIVIGLQLRQNMHLTRMSTAQTSAALLSQNFGRVIENADLAELLSAPENFENLTGADQLRVTNFVAISFRFFEILHTHKRYNIYERELWDANEARLIELLDSDATQLWWGENRKFYAPSFAVYVDGLIHDLPAPQPDEAEQA